MHAQVATGSSDELLEVLGATQSRPHNYMWLMHHFVPRKHPGSTSAANIRFLSILFVFNYENTYDREKVAFTLVFWRHLAPEHKSGRDFFTIICVFIFQTAIQSCTYRTLLFADSPIRRQDLGGPRGRNGRT